MPIPYTSQPRAPLSRSGSASGRADLQGQKLSCAGSGGQGPSLVRARHYERQRDGDHSDRPIQRTESRAPRPALRSRFFVIEGGVSVALYSTPWWPDCWMPVRRLSNGKPTLPPPALSSQGKRTPICASPTSSARRPALDADRELHRLTVEPLLYFPHSSSFSLRS